MILITGATGLVGSHILCRILNKKENVRALVRSKNSIKKIEEVFSMYDISLSEFNEKIEFVYGDVRDKVALKDIFDGITCVYHCAAMVSFNHKKKKTINDVNIAGTVNVVDLCLEHKARMVHVSSIAAVKTADECRLTTENEGWPQGKLSAYAYSKTHSEFEVWRGIAEGLNAVIVNPSVILGPGNWNDSSSKIIQTVSKGMKYFTKGTTGFVDVNDVADIMIKLMESDIHTQRYILNAENVSYEKLFLSIADHLGVKPPMKYANPKMTGIAWRMAKIVSFLTGSEPVITKDTAKAAHACQKYSSQKIQDELNFKFTAIEDTIKNTCNKYLKQVHEISIAE